MYLQLACIVLIYGHFTWADVQITYLVNNYANKDNFDIRLKKCETFSFLGDHCDPTFHFNAYTTNDLGERIVTVKKEVGPFQNTRFIESVLEASQIQQVFPNTIEFDLNIYDSDADNDQQIARFHRKFHVTKTGEMEVRLGVDVRVDVIVRIECAKDFFGDHCEIYCQPYSGLWTCHELTGERICSKPCVHGSCVLTNQSAVCVCTSGWSGEFCKLAADSSLISSIILPEMPPLIDAGVTEQESAYPNLVAESNEQYLPQLLKHSDQPGLKTTRNQLTTSNVAVSRTHQIHPEENGQSSSVTGSTTTVTKVTELTDADESPPMNTNELLPIDPVTIVTMGSRLTAELEHSVEERSNQTASLNSSLYNTWEEHASIVKQAGGFQSDSSSVYMIALITVGVIIIWAVIFLVIALLVYRQRRKNKGSNHSGSLWTNASYDLGPVSVQHSGRLYMLSDGHKYQNASGQAGSVRLSSDFSKNLRIPLNGTAKGSSNGSDGSESVRYTAPPNQTGSRIRFAAPKADPLPPAPKDIPCMTLTDPYDELTYLGEDYAVWETDTDATRPLTSFR